MFTRFVLNRSHLFQSSIDARKSMGNRHHWNRWLGRVWAHAGVQRFWAEQSKHALDES